MEKIQQVTILENEAFLRQISVPVDILKDETLDSDIALLRQFCKENEVFAMALVQLGIPKRIIYLKNTDINLVNKIQEGLDDGMNHDESRILINPEIIEREGLTEYWEACVSCLDNLGKVLRPYRIAVRYYDLEGKEHLDKFEGFESTVLSHEMDHLDGILHIDVAEELFEMPSEERKKFRTNHGYKIYAETGDYQKLKENSKLKRTK